MADSKGAIGFRKTASTKKGAFKPARKDSRINGGVMKPAKKVK